MVPGPGGGRRRSGQRFAGIADDVRMPRALDQISWVVVGYGVLVTLLTIYSAVRWRFRDAGQAAASSPGGSPARPSIQGARPPWLDSMAWMLEVLLVIRAFAGLAGLLGDNKPAAYSTHLGYLVASVCVLPIALRSVREDRGPWSLGVLGVSAVAVTVISVRIMVTL